MFFPVSLTGVHKEAGYVVMLVKQCTARIMLSNSACECFLLVLKENSAVAISQHSTYCGVMW